MTFTQVKESLTGMLHGSTLNKVRNIEALFERSANTLLSKIDPIDTERTIPLTSTIYDDVYNYSLPSDFKKIIDLSPQDNRTRFDTAGRKFAERFDLTKEMTNKTLSIEGSEGSKVLRVNWRSRPGKTLNAMNSLTANGTWSAVGSATSLVADTIFKVSGSASIKFNLVATGDGMQNTTMTAVNLTDENGVADIFFWIYFPSAPTSVTAIWGNNLTTKYWTGVAQTTQADSTAFKIGWNLLKFSWAAATQTGTVSPSTINSFKITVAAGTAISSLRVDNIIFSIGRNFDIKYYSKYIIKNSAGTWLSRTSSDDDIVVLDSDAINLFLYECLIAAAHQVEGADSVSDIQFAKTQLNGNPDSSDPVERMGLYGRYRAEHPSQSKHAVTSYQSLPRFRR